MVRAGMSKESYVTFFRISDDVSSLAYKIEEEVYDDIPVLKLFGGLSAEYTVQKAAATLAGGISHSWNVPGPGKGPGPIPSTPDFLERSVDYTVDFYNELIGEPGPIETVVITTGIPSAAYLSSSLKAPALPIHFLVGAHTTSEIQTILDYSQVFGMDAYATVGHDYSLSETQAVAWIKLLSLPPAYQKFIDDHQVKNVVFHGALGQGGESGARKLKNENGHYQAGSIYLMHFAGDDSEKYLGETIRDFDTTKLDAFTYIADWEAGVLNEQVQSIGQGIRENTGVEGIYFFTTGDAIELWNAAAYLTLSLQQKNGIQPKGISLNPYLIGNPNYEFGLGYVPFLYWQGISPAHHIDNRLEGMMKQAFLNYYPNLALGDLAYWVNSTNNFGGKDQGLAMASTLREKGYSRLVENDLEVSEVWDLRDGLNAPCELRAVEMGKGGVDFESLTIDDLRTISTSFEGLIFEEIQ